MMRGLLQSGAIVSSQGSLPHLQLSALQQEVIRSPVKVCSGQVM